jgi:regulator of sigma E protease
MNLVTALQSLLNWSVYGLPAFIFLITVVVFFHELGHFSVARLFGVKIDTFSIGFGRGWLKWKDRHGTQWKVGWLPLGGYVKFFGDADGASTPDRDAATAMSAEDRSVAFLFKPLWQRALIVAAGPVANFILAIAILTGVYALRGDVSVAPIVGEVAKNSPAEHAGIKPGDRILMVDGDAIQTYGDLSQIVAISTGDDLPIVLERGGHEFTVHATPVEVTLTDSFGNHQRGGDIGLAPSDPPLIDSVLDGSPAQHAGLQVGDVIVSVDGLATPKLTDVQRVVQPRPGQLLTVVFRRAQALRSVVITPIRNAERKGQLGVTFGPPKVITHMGPLTALGTAVDTVQHLVGTTFRALFHSSTGVRQVSGIITIAKVSGQVASVGLVELIMLAAFLSVSIGLVNLFPIPLLDGGHLLYYAFEGVLGRPLGERAQDVGFRLGLAVVAGIFLLVTWNDLLNLF